jgi:hypothetical protein
MELIKEFIKHLDHFEIRIRHQLSHWPIVYAFLGSVGVVFIWRGIWMISDDLGMSGVSSLFWGVAISISIGLFVSFFVGDKIIISGIKSEKRIDEKTEDEIKKEEISLVEIKKDLKEIKEEIDEIDEK